ncbi:MAG TPA: DUF1566 domain-containing protein [Polyangiales bacterium]|nr:DUF1566 domain-containing protein [Polyangiales bacterium]
MFAIRKLRRAMVVLAFGAVAVPTRADAPSGQYSAKDGTVHDNRTGLSWQQQAEPVERTWSEAGSYCAELTLAAGGWRLPTYKELLTLVDPTRTSPAIDTASFPSAASAAYWTASSYGGMTSHAWYVDFSDGNSNYAGTGTKRYARCVR